MSFCRSLSTKLHLSMIAALLLAPLAAAGCGGEDVDTNADEDGLATPLFGSDGTTTTSAPLPEDAPIPAALIAGGGLGPLAQPAPPTTSEPPKAMPLPYRGVNLAGGEFGSALPGSEGKDYKWPTASEVDYYVGKGMNTFRIGFKWERLQPKAQGELDAKYLAKLDALVTHTTSKGAAVILNPHNFARYYGSTVGSSKVPSSAFADLWRRLALRYASNARVMFNLVNEPNNMPTEQWVNAANAAIAAIREAGATNLIHVPGNGWTGAYSWTHSYYGTPNADAMLDIVDPANNLVFEVHQYLDANSSGSSDECVSKTIGSERLASFVSWLRAHGKKGFVGEFAGGNNTTCNAAVEDMLASMMDASDVLVGWQWWAAGPAWGSYPFSLHPQDGQDRPQMSLLVPWLTAQ